MSISSSAIVWSLPGNDAMDERFHLVAQMAAGLAVDRQAHDRAIVLGGAARIRRGDDGAPHDEIARAGGERLPGAERARLIVRGRRRGADAGSDDRERRESRAQHLELLRRRDDPVEPRARRKGRKLFHVTLHRSVDADFEQRSIVEARQRRHRDDDRSRPVRAVPPSRPQRAWPPSAFPIHPTRARSSSRRRASLPTRRRRQPGAGCRET